MPPSLKWLSRLADTVGTLAIPLLKFDWATIRRLLAVNSLFDATRIVGNFSNMKDLIFHVDMKVAASSPVPLPAKPTGLPAHFTFRSETFNTAHWMAERRFTAIVALRDGHITHEDYFLGTGREDLRISWSMAKSVLSAAFGVAVTKGTIPSIDLGVIDFVPLLKGTAYDGATIKNVLQMASGVRFNEDYLDYDSDINRMGRVLALGQSMDGFAASLKTRDREPGARTHYVSIDTHVLGMVLRAATGQGADEYVSEHILGRLGLEGDAYYLSDREKNPFVLGGLNMRTRDYARFGLMFAQKGQLNGQQIVSEAWISESTANSAPPPIDEVAGTDDGLLGYGYQWWVAPKPRKGEFFAHGIYGQFIYIDQTRKTVIATNAADLGFTEGDGRVTLEHIAFFRAIADQG